MLQFIIYTDDAAQYRWRLVDAHQHVLAVSTDAYAKENDLRAALDLLRHQVRLAKATHENRMVLAEIPMI